MRRIVQLVSGNVPYALCDDGTVWMLGWADTEEHRREWIRMPDIPAEPLPEPLPSPTPTLDRILNEAVDRILNEGIRFPGSAP